MEDSLAYFDIFGIKRDGRLYLTLSKVDTTVRKEREYRTRKSWCLQ